MEWTIRGLVVLVGFAMLGSPTAALCPRVASEAVKKQLSGKRCNDALKDALRVDLCFLAKEDTESTKKAIEVALGSPLSWVEDDGGNVGTYTTSRLSGRVRIETVKEGKRRQVTVKWSRKLEDARTCSLVEAEAANAGPFSSTLVTRDGIPRKDGDRLTEPKITLHVDPCYPHLAYIARLGGKVIVLATIGAGGAVEDACILRCSRPNMEFEQEAIDAVKEWRYEPATLNGQPVAVTSFLLVEFKPQ